MARRKRQSTLRPNKTGATENPNARVRECKVGGVAREPQSAKRNFESVLRGDQDSPGGPAERRRIDGQKQEPLHVSKEHGRNPNPRATRIGFLEGSASKRLAGWTRDGSGEEIAGWMLEAQRLKRGVEAKKRKLQEAIEKESGKGARMGDESMDGLDGSLSS